MPYIAIRSYPKDEDTKRRLVERFNQDIMEICGVPAQAITISYEEIVPEEWADKVVKTEVEPKMDKMYIVKGEKKY